MSDTERKEGEASLEAGAERPDLARLIACAAATPEHPSTAEAVHMAALRTLAARLAESRLQIAVLGQFKRGKSSLLNALLGHAVKPVDVLPSTSIPVFIAGDTALGVKVAYRDGSIERHRPADDERLCEMLTGLVTEEGNPENRRGVGRVEVSLPSPLLAEGAVVIDTPGVGSTYRHNTAAAQSALAECDAALFVVSPDPPITETELSYLERVRDIAASVIVVLNKVDLLGQKDRETSQRFLQRVLAGTGHPAAAMPVFAVSARGGLRAKQAGDPSGAAASGLTALEQYLLGRLGQEKAEILHAAIAGKAAALVGAMRLEAEIRLRSLRMPLDELEQRMAAFDQAITGIEEEQRDVRDRLAGDRLRLIEELEARAAEVEDEARTLLLEELDRLAEREPIETLGAALADRAASFFDRAYGELSRRLEVRLSAVLEGHRRRADARADKIRRAAAETLELRAAPALASEVPGPSDQPFWAATGRTESFTQISMGLASRLLPASLRRRRAHRQAVTEVKVIVTRNVENMRWAIRQAIEAGLRRFASGIDQHLAIALAATRDAMRAARVRRREHAGSVEQQIADEEAVTLRLSRLEGTLRGLRDLHGSAP